MFQKIVSTMGKKTKTERRAGVRETGIFGNRLFLNCFIFVNLYPSQWEITLSTKKQCLYMFTWII